MQILPKHNSIPSMSGFHCQNRAGACMLHNGVILGWTTGEIPLVCWLSEGALCAADGTLTYCSFTAVTKLLQLRSFTLSAYFIFYYFQHCFMSKEPRWRGFTFIRCLLIRFYMATCFRVSAHTGEITPPFPRRKKAKNSQTSAVSNVCFHGLQDDLPFHQHQECHWPRRLPSQWKHKDIVRKGAKMVHT